MCTGAGATSAGTAGSRVADSKKEDESELSSEYSDEMQTKMGTSLTYVHEAGMNYDRITPDIVVGSCLQTADDVDR